jgi:hypothetical protein
MLSDQIIEYKEGMEIPKHCVISGMPLDVYLQHEALGSSDVKLLNITIQHFLDADKKETDSTRLGSQFHGVLEAARTGKPIEESICVVNSYKRNESASVIGFIKEYYPFAFPGNPKPRFEKIKKDNYLNGNIIKMCELKEMAVEVAEAYASGREIVTQDVYDTSIKMKNALAEHPQIRKLFALDGYAELSFFTEIEVDDNGVKVMMPVPVKCRSDLLTEDERIGDQIWSNDWKSISKIATERNIRNQVLYDYQYHISLAMYDDIIRRFTGKDVFTRIIFVETVKPSKYKIRAFDLSEENMVQGWYRYREGLTRWAQWKLDPECWKGFKNADEGFETLY